MAEQRNCICTYTTMDAPGSCFQKDVEMLKNLPASAFCTNLDHIQLAGNCFKIPEKIYLDSVFMEVASSMSTEELLITVCHLDAGDKRYYAIKKELKWRHIKLVRLACVMPDSDPYHHQVFMHACEDSFHGIGFWRRATYYPDDAIRNAIIKGHLRCGTAEAMTPSVASYGQLATPSHQGANCREFRPKLQKF